MSSTGRDGRERARPVGARGIGVRGAAAASLALTLTACQSLPPADPPVDIGVVRTGFPPCEDLATLTGDLALYRDEPRYGNAMELTEAVHAWAERTPGFQEMWLDRDHHGWIHVGVHGADVDVTALQEEVAREFPGEGVVVVKVPHSSAELVGLLERVGEALADADASPALGASASVSRGRVELHGVPTTVAAEDALREFAGEPLCVDTHDPAAQVPEGEQPTAGEGWRLLGHEPDVGEAYRTGVATTDDQLAAMWAVAGLPGEAPDVDWEREVVVWFGEVWGSSCPVRMDDVGVSGGVVHAVTVIPGTSSEGAVCTGDARPHAFVVALERILLPTGPFAVQLSSSDLPARLTGRTEVDVDLSAPGSVAEDHQIRDVTTEDVPPEPPPLVADGEDLPPGGARYVWRDRPECSAPVIGPLGGTLWRLADGEPEWTEEDGTELGLSVDDDLMIAFAPGWEWFFVPAGPDVCG